MSGVRRRFVLQVSIVLACWCSDGALAQGLDTRGAALAAVCVTCHGPGGRSEGRLPSLHTLSAAELFAALQAFRTGERPGTVMPRLLQGLNEADLKAVAAYFATPPQAP